MCTGNIFSKLSPYGSVVSGVGDIIQTGGVARQREARGSRIASSAVQSIRQKATALGRRRSAQEAAFGKAGVRMTGSAKQVLEEQIKQDELELLTDRYNADLAIESEFDKASEARVKGVSSLIAGAIQTGKKDASSKLQTAKLGLSG